MIIANPLYDVVFKSLMEDVDIAKGLISSLTGMDVIELQARPREEVIPIEVGHNVTIYRLDYVATIRNADGTGNKVLVEVQKAKFGSEIRRFRTYLGKQYIHPETVFDEDGEELKIDLPIVAVYILGFSLGIDIPAYCKVNRTYMNALTGDCVDANSDFIEALSHDMYILQASKVGHQAETELERLISIFSQSDFAEENGHTITYPDPMTKAKSKLLKRILRHLTKLSSSRQVREKMDAEDQAYSEFQAAVQNQTKEIRNKLKEAQKQKEESQKREEEERRQKEESQKREEEERRQKEESQKREEEERRQKEDVLKKINKALKELKKSGMPEEQAKKLLGL
jgi:Skp family chaperone for outer membrane proteins